MLMKAALILTCINPSDGPKEELKFLVKSQGNGMLVRVLSLPNVVQKYSLRFVLRALVIQTFLTFGSNPAWCQLSNLGKSLF